MSTIISISVPEKMEKEIDSLAGEFGFSGRSEMVRAGLQLLADEKKQNAKLSGKIDAVLIIVHADNHEAVSQLSHRFDAEIKTRLHHHLANGKCMELFILRGDAKKITGISGAFRSNKKIDFVKLIAQ